MPLYIFTKSCPTKLYFELGAKQKKKMRKGRKRKRKEEGGRERVRKGGVGGGGGTEKDSASQPLDTTPTSQPSLFL